jgi:uncharacterized membrane protein YhaH (DUF805 family)
MNWYIKCWKQYADFRTRARRREFWLFVLFNSIILSLLMYSTSYLMYSTSSGLLLFYHKLSLLKILRNSMVLVLFITSLSVMVRRLHDVGKSGWMCCIGLIPLVGAIWLFVLLCKNSQPVANKWGENPKGIAAPAAVNGQAL